LSAGPIPIRLARAIDDDDSAGCAVRQQLHPTFMSSETPEYPAHRRAGFGEIGLVAITTTGAIAARKSF
jgi:hypothetical protein